MTETQIRKLNTLDAPLERWVQLNFSSELILTLLIRRYPFMRRSDALDHIEQARFRTLAAQLESPAPSDLI